ncbi:MAG TPA: ACT domain-containing protein [Desulfosalsimonadaceae bacterium]|nr:ACT domain-containing protein [Desulfosalsimonadaceae bacterium]
MRIRQISIFMENRSGRLAKITTTIGNAGINIRAMSLADTSDFGILRLVVTDTEKARQVLKDQGFTVKVSDVIAVSIPDIPGALGNLLSIIEHENLNVEYMYVVAEKRMDEAIIIFRFDDLDKAVEVLMDNDIHVVDESKVLSV